ncbi:MAG: glucose 1-dehydrogenase [Deltaproteobacteria bacterium]|nr:glucose 1-dehydrogenase [Deltaproteobacteria bacterium]
MGGKLDGKRSLITGASRGIGEAIAAAFAREGARVLIASRKADGLEAAAARIRESQPEVEIRTRACHMGKPEQVEALAEFAFAELGGLDVLVNNAATNPYFGPMLDLERAAWDKTIEVNLLGPFELCRQVARRWVDAGSGGAVVNVSSVLGMRAAPLQGIYGMTKAALISMTRTLAVELAPSGIRVNAIAPGLVDTRFASVLVGTPDIVKVFTDHTAQKRYAQPEEMAGAVVFLASDEASHITGHTLSVDGGYCIA